ncbi:MAG: tRNA pseudouridine(13) synthase TruD, partial [Nanobdellota archaeon]
EQYISIEKGKNKNLDEEKITLEYLGRGEERLTLGSHDRNWFRIKVKGTDNEPILPERPINYFGRQRFSKNNHNIGRHLVKKEFKEAVDLILESEGKQEEALREFFKKNPNDYIGALQRIPKKILTLYIHAYQSELFNSMARGTKKEKLPLIGFGTRPDEETKNILNEEGIKPRDFIIRQLPELSAEGEYRDVIMDVKDFDKEKEEDGWVVTFSLGKGSYATTLIEQIFRQELS